MTKGRSGEGACAWSMVLMQGKKTKLKTVSFVCVCVVLPVPPSALRTAGFRNGSLGNRPSAPFRSNVYQPTEMAVVLNGGTVSIRR